MKNIIPSLDGLRAISILIVATAHCGFGNIIPGGLGVTIFFFLSGYLITTLLQDEYRETQRIDVIGFFKRRFIRLSPPFFCTLTLACALVGFGILHGNLKMAGPLSQALYFANYYSLFWDDGQSVAPGTEVFWSLAVEEHFYIFYPFVVFFMFKELTKRQMLGTLVSICVAVLLWRCYLILVTHVTSNRTYYATDTRIDSILFGCVFALWFNSKRVSLSEKLSRRKAVLCIVASCALMAVSLAIRADSFRETLRYSLQGLAIIPAFAVLLLGRNGFLHKLLNHSILIKVGQHSYAFYLIHFIVLKIIVQHYNQIGRITLLFCVVGVSYLYALIMQRYIERPARRLRDVSLRGWLRTRSA